MWQALAILGGIGLLVEWLLFGRAEGRMRRPKARVAVLRPDLDLWSQRALRLGPKVKTLIASRGAVLIELGRHREGKALLETVAFADGVSLADSLLNRIFLARAEHALGNAAAAGRLLAEARAIARASFRGPVLTAWNGHIQREVREMRSGYPRVRRPLGRRSLKAQGKLSLPRRRVRLRFQRRL